MQNLFLRYSLFYAMLFICTFVSYIVVVRLVRPLASGWLPFWGVLIGLVLVILAPAYVTGRKFVRKERRAFIKPEGVLLALCLAVVSDLVIIAVIYSHEAWLNFGTQTLAQTWGDLAGLGELVLIAAGYAVVATLPFRAVLWLAMRSPLQRLEASVARTFE